MMPEFDKKLCKNFPLLYADRHVSMQSTCMCWGFDVGAGWSELIYTLSEKLEALIEKFIEENKGICDCSHKEDEHDISGCKILYPANKFNEEECTCACDKFKQVHPKASQVKEKFGGLRFYMTYETDEMSEFIEQAEEQSYTICESCSTPGELMSTGGGNARGWCKTLCHKCAENTLAYKKQKYAPAA